MKSEVIQIFTLLEKINNDFYKNSERFRKLILKYSDEKEKKFNEYILVKENKFCIFDNFSPKYYYEELHSEILKTLLDKNTLDILNDNFLNIFIKCLNLENMIQFDENVLIKLEHPINPRYPAEAIDILIYDKDKALIIENKINFAKDQPNQLARYMKYVEEELQIRNYYVIYLTLTPDKKPLINNYSEEYAKYKEHLLKQNKLIHLSAVENDNNKKSLVNNFLKECEQTISAEIEKKGTIDNLILTKCYLNQYRILLNKLGGFATMKSTDRKLAKEIFNDKKLIDASIDFIDFWENRYNALYPIIFEEVKENILGLTEKENDQWFYLVVKENCSIYFECNGHFSIGFVATEKKWTDEKLDELKRIINDYAQKNLNYFTCKSRSDNGNLPWADCFLKDNLTIEELKEIIIKSFMELSKLVKENKLI